MAVRFQMRVAGAPGGAAIPPARVAGILGCVAFGVATLLYVLGALFWSGQRVANFDVRQGTSFEHTITHR
jgi:hypothetical protein